MVMHFTLAPWPCPSHSHYGHALHTQCVQVEQDGRSVAMRFTLTPDLIAMVFAEKPHVRRAYDKNVPTNMSEKEFWTRYLKNEMAKEVKRGVGWEKKQRHCGKENDMRQSGNNHDIKLLFYLLASVISLLLLLEQAKQCKY
eukprot:1160110-Pelagomonas_calceolata.AAC.5